MGTAVQPPAAPLVGETCQGLSTWDAAVPHRPGTADFNGASMQNANGANGTIPPPLGDGSMPTAALLNTWSLLAIAFGGIIPNLRVSVTAGATPFLSFAQGAPSWVSLSAFVVTRNTAGDYSITYGPPAGTTAWAAATFYLTGPFITPPIATGFYYQCTTSGTTGATPPSFPIVVGATVADGSAVWTCVAPINALPPPASQPSHSLNLPGGLAPFQEYAISAINIQNGVRVTTSQGGTLTDLNFSVSIY
jgi:hypothetical protein